MCASTGGGHGHSGSGSSAELGEALVRAAMTEDVRGVRAALEAGAPPGFRSSVNGSGMTPLMWAASGGCVEVARMLLDAGLTVEDLNAQTDRGYCAMVYAMEGLPKRAGGDRKPFPPGFPNDPKKREKTVPKQVEAVGGDGHASVAKLLLMRGADVRVRNEFEETLVAIAARKGQTDWIDLLVSSGLSVRDANKGYAQTPLHLAAMEGHADAVRFLLSVPGCEVDARNVVGWTPLLWAVATGSVDCVDALIKAGADVNVEAVGTTKEDGTQTTTKPLREARRCVEPRKVSLLLIRAGATE